MDEFVVGVKVNRMPFGTMAPDSFASIKYPDQFIIIRWQTWIEGRREGGSVRIIGSIASSLTSLQCDV